MPRRAGPSSSRSGGRPPPPPPRKSSPQNQSQNNQKSPGLFKQSAAIAGGVAAGTAVGHAVGSALTGGNRYRERDDEEYYSQQQQQQQSPSEQDPCAKEIQAFLKCTQEQKDISICEGFNEAIKQCRKYGSSALSDRH